jgi:Domain of unknown function (DUF397)
VTDQARKAGTVKVTLARAAWRKSSHSGGSGNCVEVAGNLPGAVGVRDSKDPCGPTLIVGPHAWRAFTTMVKSDELDLTDGSGKPCEESPCRGLFVL